jgi:hypothetical protein
MLLKLTKIGERESHFERDFLFGVLHDRGFLRPRGQNKHKHKVTVHTLRKYTR